VIFSIREVFGEIENRMISQMSRTTENVQNMV